MFTTRKVLRRCVLIKRVVLWVIWVSLAEQPESESAGVPVSDEEMIDILYKPQEAEWGDKGRDQASARIVAGIEQLVTVGTLSYLMLYFFCHLSSSDFDGLLGLEIVTPKMKIIIYYLP